jgi:hypothetical protein
MEHNSFSEVEVIKFSPKLDNQEIFDPEEEEKINTSNSYSVPTSSMYYNSEGETTEPEQDIVETKKGLTVANPDPSSSNSDKSSKAGSIKNKLLTDSINMSLQNNINDNSIPVSPVSKESKILPKNLTSDKHKSIDKKSDTSSIIVEINAEDEEIIEIDNEDGLNNSFVVVDQINGLNGAAENLKKKLQMTENRVSLTTTGDFTYVDNDQSQNTRNDVDLSMPEKSDIVNTNLKRLTDTTSIPPVIDDKVKESSNEVDKAAADISNKEHKITIDDEDEDNTCAICLIETQKPTDIVDINKGSNETVVAPSKEDIDNFECKLHCMHKFHYSCIAQWLERNQNCPICRVEIKRYEIEAIEKRFDISIKVKGDPVPLIVPHYNVTFDLDCEITEDLVRSYMSEHLPWVKFYPYFYTKFYFYFLGFLALVIFGIVASVISFTKGHQKFSFVTYCIVLTLIICFIIFLSLFIKSIKNNKAMVFMIKQPGSSSFYYGFNAFLFLLLLVNLGTFIEDPYNIFTLEKVFGYCVTIFFGIMMFWSYVEVIFCYDMFKEVNRHNVDADVSRRNQELVERAREEEAEERAEFERNFSHLND